MKVTASSRVSYVFAQAIPGGPHEADIHATSIARPAQAVARRAAARRGAAAEHGGSFRRRGIRPSR